MKYNKILIGTKLKLLDIVSSKAEENKFTIITTVTNSGLEEHFYIRQLGIFAKGLSIDGLNTEILPEKLIAIAYDTNPDVIPAETNNIPYTKQMNIGFSINNADKAEIILSLTGVVTSDVLENHNNDTNAHRSLFKSLFNLTDMTLNSMKSIIQNWSKEVCLPLLGGTMKGNINASDYNITATKFIGNLQGKADSAANADLATKANQDSQGQTINTTYVKGITASNATLTLTKGNGTTSTVTINNVANANNVSVAQKFKFNLSGGGNIYRIFARTYLSAGDGYGNSTFIITSTGNFGSNVLGSYIVNISNRGSDASMYVRELIPDNSNSTTFGYYQDGSYFYFGLRNNSYSGECSVTPLNISSVSGHEVGNYKNDRTPPSGWTPVTTGKLAPITSPAFSGSPTAPTPATTDNSTRVATTAYVKNNISETLKKVYPVGSIYMSTVSTNPATLFGFGTWEAMPAGRVLLAQGTASWGTYNAGSTGGEATHQLTVGEMPSHSHSASTNTTGNHNHAIQCNGWSGASTKVSSYYSKDWQLTAYTDNAGNHSHSVTINNTGSNQAHNNLQPYISVYIWKRIS